MNRRTEALREESLAGVARVSPERAYLITEFYRQYRGPLSTAVERALAFQYLLERKTIYIGPRELIVGERGPLPKATPTYPELCCHSLEDLKILNSREKVSFAVDQETRRLYQQEIIPFWQGKSMRDLIFREMSPQWKAAYRAGIFTEFMEQRAPGHTVLDDKIYHKGFLGFKEDIARSMESLDLFDDPQAYQKREQLRAMDICASAIIRFAHRHAEKAEELAASEPDQARREELREIARICRHVPANPPSTFREALQSYWFVHLGVITELNTWDAFSPGRLDQHLYPFYQRDVDNGILDEAGARELLQCFWIKFNNQPAPPKVGVTAAESATYTDFANINTGGLKPDGSDGVNQLTYLVLDVIDEMRLVQPSSNIQLSKKSPERFLKHACRVIRKGWGQPSVFNADAIVAELVRQGKAIADARSGGASGCVEAGAFGKESYILTGYLNLVKILEVTLHNGVDPRTGELIGLSTGDPGDFESFPELMEAFREQLGYFIDLKIQGNNLIERLFAQHMPSPFLSLLIDDCIARGQDYNDGGARYNTTYVQGVGLGTLSDSMSALRYHLFDRKSVSMEELLGALQSDFLGHEPLRQRLVNQTPRYGNDDPYADSIMKDLFESFYQQVDGRPNTKGGRYRINMLPTTCHVYFGSVCGATPDGRHSGRPLSEGISPVQGSDRKGPTAVIKSASKMDHLRTGGTLLNMKLTPDLVEGDDGLERLAHLIRAYFALDGHHIQFNIVSADTLRAAQEEPEQYRDLIVRVAGYSDYFGDLGRDLQDEIISRTEHRSL